MRKLLVLLVLVAGVLAFTNPGMEAFQTHVKERSAERIEERTGSSALGSALAGAGSNLIARNIDAVTTRRSYLVASRYDVDPDGDGTAEWQYVGIASTFFALREPDRQE
jgi:hypothetical protein